LAILIAAGLSLVSASEAERRERLGLWVGDISLMPNGTLHGFNCGLDLDEGLKQVFRVSAILLLRQSFRDVASVHNLSISCCDQLLSVPVILSHSGGLPSSSAILCASSGASGFVFSFEHLAAG
jgi:hypothetical protein